MNASQQYTQKGKIRHFFEVSSIAQEEARSISENVTWGHRKRMADGKYAVAYSRFLGYDKGEDGTLVINEEEAKTVKLIYKLFLEGYSVHKIASMLTDMKIQTPGKKNKWHQGTVSGILTNEKYKGDVLLQKYYTVDFLTKKQKPNDGSIPQYYIENDHEPIVSKEVFEMVQNEIQRRMKSGVRYSGVSIFANRVKCMDCGSWYGSKVWHSNNKYKKIIYRCNHKYGKDKVCTTPHFTEDELKDMVVYAINEIIKNKKQIIDTIEKTTLKVFNIEKLEKEKAELLKGLETIAEKQEALISKNSKVVQNQEKYNEEFIEITKKYEKAKEEYENKEKEIVSCIGRKEELKNYIDKLKKNKMIKTFNEELFAGLVSEIDIYKDKKVVVFKDGKSVEV